MHVRFESRVGIILTFPMTCHSAVRACPVAGHFTRTIEDIPSGCEERAHVAQYYGVRSTPSFSFLPEGRALIKMLATTVKVIGLWDGHFPGDQPVGRWDGHELFHPTQLGHHRRCGSCLKGLRGPVRRRRLRDSGVRTQSRSQEEGAPCRRLQNCVVPGFVWRHLNALTCYCPNLCCS